MFVFVFRLTDVSYKNIYLKIKSDITSENKKIKTDYETKTRPHVSWFITG